MRNVLLKLFSFVAVAAAFGAAPAYAQATRTWVSGVGDDVNPCSRTAPCKTFAGAISKTAAGGEINTLDSAGFGAVTITKSITIKADGTVGGIAATGTTGITVNALSTDRIVLDGLDIDGFGTGVNGIRVIQARDVVIVNSSIRNFRSGVNSAGVVVDGPVAITIKNTTIEGNNIGVLVAPVTVGGIARIYDSFIVSNTTSGIRASGSGNAADIKNTEVLRSTKALDIQLSGVIRSYGDNVLGAGDTPTPTPKG